jgi:hypothetical protein
VSGTRHRKGSGPEMRGRGRHRCLTRQKTSLDTLVGVRLEGRGVRTGECDVKRNGKGTKMGGMD